MSELKKTGQVRATREGSPDGDKKVEKLLYDANKNEIQIWDKKGKLDPKAFKKLIFERQAGSLSGPKNTLSAAVN